MPKIPRDQETWEYSTSGRGGRVGRVADGGLGDEGEHLLAVHTSQRLPSGLQSPAASTHAHRAWLMTCWFQLNMEAWRSFRAGLLRQHASPIRLWDEAYQLSRRPGPPGPPTTLCVTMIIIIPSDPARDDAGCHGASSGYPPAQKLPYFALYICAEGCACACVVPALRVSPQGSGVARVGSNLSRWLFSSVLARDSGPLACSPSPQPKRYPACRK